MVAPTCCAPIEAGSRRYSRPCPPYSFAYPDRRLHISSQDNRAIIMTDREESDQPRKRIAVATNTRTTPSVGDAASGRFGVVVIQEMEGHAPIVSSTERHLKDSDYPYNIEAARAYAHQSPGAVSPLTSLPQYGHDITPGDGLTSYRQGPYPYTTHPSNKAYYPTIPTWTSTYADDSTSNVDYGLNYSSYQIISQEPSLVPGYSQYSPRKSVYVDPEASSYSSYGNLVHRPAVNNDSQGFSLSSIAASLPSASERLHSGVNRTLTSSSSYRPDGLPTQYTKTSPTSTIPDVAYSNLQPAFESPYSTTGTITSPVIHRPSSHADVFAQPPGTAAATDQLYTPSDQNIRPNEDASGGLSYVYGENKLGSRRDSHASGAVSTGPLLSNGHVYVPDSHSAHPTPNPYVVSSTASSSHGRGTVDRAAAADATGVVAVGRGGGSSSGPSHRQPDSQRRSAGSLRGA
ncbi:hypothetical protein F5Y07DRAFT_407993 [Xylaria sp. FL0933]|nr:hypothetical protein F5Y07DRAFT_407993 [Xylaria sp. FL0933]